jgi:hypothetical protein
MTHDAPTTPPVPSPTSQSKTSFGYHADDRSNDDRGELTLVHQDSPVAFIDAYINSSLEKFAIE